jgi:ATP-dependent Clp protease ATP-binding subunit ClpA
MHERFTDRARKVMQLANQEAQRCNHDYVGTEHILLGLVKEGSGIAAKVLASRDIDLRKIRLQAEQIVRWGPANMVTPGHLPQTPRAKRVIEYAIEEARKLGHHYVGTEHLLLGLVRETESVGAEILRNLDLRLDDLRVAVMAVIESSSYAVQSAPCTPGLAAQCQAGDGFSEENIQRAEEVDHLQDRPTEGRSGMELHLDPPDLESLVIRPGVVGGVWNFLLRLVRAKNRKVPTYQEPPWARRYTSRARLVLHRACVEASWMHHEYLDTEHILLGLLTEGMAARILENLGVPPAKVRLEVHRIIRFGPENHPIPKVLPWTPWALRVLQYACAEASLRGQHGFVGTEHLLLGLLCQYKGVGGRVLLDLGLTRERVREEIQRLVGCPD